MGTEHQTIVIFMGILAPISHGYQETTKIVKQSRKEDLGSYVFLKMFVSLCLFMINLPRNNKKATYTVSPTSINHLQGDFSFHGNSNIYLCATALAGL